MNTRIPTRGHEARLNITLHGQNGDLVDPVPFGASDAELRRWAAEAVRSGSVPGVSAQRASFADFIVDRFPASDAVPFHRIFLRPSTPFG
ncbi:MAG: hypothetical protein H6741_08305 [Alphaproteobacteria bacterium]|nr:hypothetical protein [Alphaproteobacteria bacterium]MCB9792720.1 hypothetical protein [Alphaproteobacteria bacterium]